MKQKKIISIIAVLCGLFFLFMGSIANATFNNPSDYYKILTQDDQRVIESDSITDPLGDGSYQIAGRVNGLYMKSGKITSFLQAQNAALAYAQNIINWTLLIVGTVALIYLLYTGFQMVTAAGDETKFKERTKKTRAAMIALLGIGLSAIFVNFVLYVIDKVI